jgi:hypothetical protein
VRAIWPHRSSGGLAIKARFAVVIGLVLALGVSGLAFAAGTDENTEGVLGSVKPTKLDKKKYKPVDFYTGVTTTTTHPVPGQQNPEKQLIEFGTNVKFDLTKADICNVPLNGTTTDQAKALCPAGSNVGSGVANADLGQGPQQVNDVTVTVFNGPGPNQIRLHAYSPFLTAANTQVVLGSIIKAPSGGKYGQALFVADAPDLAGDAFMLTKFDALITKASKTVSARCKAKEFLWHNVVTYDDGTTDEADLSQKCKQKKS